MPITNPATDTTMYLALELSRSSWLAAARLPGGEKGAMRRMAAGDTQSLLAFIARQRARAEAQLGAPIRVASCFEAGPDGFWLHRVLRERRVEQRMSVLADLILAWKTSAR